MFQRLQLCQNLARRIASENNDKSIEESPKYFNSKVKPVEFKEDDWALLKEHNFYIKTKKLLKHERVHLESPKFMRIVQS
jgi:hypothetical protein